MLITRMRTATALLAAVGLTACGEGTGPTMSGQMTLSLATRAAGPATAPARSAAPDTVTAGTDVLVLDKVELVLRELELERVNDDACDDLPGQSHDDCEELDLGPLLLDLPLGPGAARQFTVAVDTGTFDEIEFEIHKPEDDGNAAERAFLQANPDFRGISIRASGTFNGEPFVFTSDLSAEQELDLVPPLVITEATAIDVTLFVDVRSWFRNGTALVDPRTANRGGPAEGLVKENIKRSIEVFEDDDHDGHDDHCDDHDGAHE